jgi:uncharacterized protein (TIGR01777 family)
LSGQGHTIVKLVRSKPRAADERQWDPEAGWAVREAFEGFDAVIHLAGEPLTLGRWSTKKKQKILYSRTVGTWLLAHILSSLPQPPKVFISASAFGFYGDRGEEMLDEESARGNGFLPTVCSEWEGASQALRDRGTRTIQTRFGIVIGPAHSRGGMLHKMLLPYRLGLGATLGTGMQWVSWIALHDLICAMEHILQSHLEGPVNFVSPHPVRQKEFSKTLAQLLARPAWLRIPAPALKFILGQTAEELLLASARVAPVKLLDSGFTFKYPTLKEALTIALLS